MKITEDTALERYDDMLNDIPGHIMIGGMTVELSRIDAARILKELDPIAYRCGFNDWLDAEGLELGDEDEFAHVRDIPDSYSLWTGDDAAEYVAGGCAFVLQEAGEIVDVYVTDSAVPYLDASVHRVDLGAP